MEPRDHIDAAALATLGTAPAAEQLLAPLDFLFAEHLRQRILCGMLDEIAEAQARDGRKVAAVMEFLAHDLGTHVRDEEEDLFPMLRRRADRVDHIEAVLAELSEEHAADRLDAEAIVDVLSRIGALEDAWRPAPGACRLLKRFAANERRHLITENAIVLPLARAVLRRRDLEGLGRGMAARRGWAYPGEAGDA
jgi:hemerythrin-like domain-containing protein